MTPAVLHLHLRGGNRPALGEAPLIAVEDLGCEHTGASGVGRSKTEGKRRVLADRDVRFETEYRAAVVGDLEGLHEVGRDVVAAQLVDLQTGGVRGADQELGGNRGSGRGPGGEG